MEHSNHLGSFYEILLICSLSQCPDHATIIYLCLYSSLMELIDIKFLNCKISLLKLRLNQIL